MQDNQEKRGSVEVQQNKILWTDMGEQTNPHGGDKTHKVGNRNMPLADPSLC